MNPFEQQATESADAIRSSTVLREAVRRDGRKFVDRYTGECKDLVEKRAEAARAAIDFMASPSVYGPYEIQGGWACDLTWWSVD